MRKAAALAVLLMLVAPLTAFAQSHTAEDEAACTPDVVRLCQQYIPKRQDIIACLESRKSELSPACHEVFSRPAPKKAQDSRRPPRRPTSESGGTLY